MTILKQSEVTNGFLVKNIRPISEIDAQLYEMEHIQSGCKLKWIDRDDENKTFLIGFKTIPSDDTGVFHILEHSVLNGSDKFTAKEPFVELLKGSLNTFLNAMTYPDKTLYPVSSRNNQDFINLIRVYMDAVLHPAIYNKPEIFYQEGWHYEMLSPEDTPIYKGVVYNEMKGSYSSVDTIIEAEMNKALFPDTCYQYSSGGDPDYIPELTYKKFIDSHKEFYNPSNAIIILDGKIDILTILKILNDEFLSEFKNNKSLSKIIPMQFPITADMVSKKYEISPTEGLDKKSHISFAYVYGTFEDTEKTIALQILQNILAVSNTAPLKKAVLESNLAQDLNIRIHDGIQQPFVYIEVKNTDEDKFSEIRSLIEATLSDICKKGISKEQLISCLNNQEFYAKERNYGFMPMGLGLGIEMLDSCLYGGDSIKNLSYADFFNSLRKKMNEGYFEELIDKTFLNNKHKATIAMIPSNTLGEEKRNAEIKRLDTIKKSWNDEQISNIINMNNKLQEWQRTVDTKEQLETLPTLKLSDISSKPELISLAEIKILDTTILKHNISTNGIVYLNLYFSAEGSTLEELSHASLLCNLLGKMDTKLRDNFSLQMDIKSKLGNIRFSPESYAKLGKDDSCTPYLTVQCSFLDANISDAIRLIREILYDTNFNDLEKIKNLVSQLKLQYEQSIIMNGHNFASLRVSSFYTEDGVVKEHFNGYEFYNWLKDINENFDKYKEKLIDLLNKLFTSIFTRERLTASVTGNVSDQNLLNLIEAIPAANQEISKVCYTPLGVRQEGIIIPAGISFAVKGSNLFKLGRSYTGSSKVLSKLLSLSYLWNTVRIQGGAYGAGFSSSENGNSFYYSYRDPNAYNSIDCYDNSAKFIEEFCNSEEDLTKYIIGTISDTEPLLTPRDKAKQSDSNYLRGITYDYLCNIRKEILHTTKHDLYNLCDTLNMIEKENAICVIGSKDIINSCSDRLKTIMRI